MSTLLLASSEDAMWEGLPDEPKQKISDAEINEKYTNAERRVVTEVNREQLPNFIEALKRPGWMELRPFYQRRLRWDLERQSRLIESFIMNIPIPPLFVYEADFAKYEVMDGQQRISTIRDFYANSFALTGLEQWPELNGRVYSKLPSDIKKGIDRRSISYYVLLKESTADSEGETLLRQQVFERLNTGGVKLSNQEIRNSIYYGKFNKLLMDLVKLDDFRDVWGLPRYSPDEETNPPQELLDIQFYAQMRDAEIVLRFFALRHANHYRNGMSGFLDLYSVRSQKFTDDDIVFLESLFKKTLSLAREIFGDLLFHPFEPDEDTWSSRTQIAFADAVMVGLSRHLERAHELRDKSEEIKASTASLFKKFPPGTFTGQKNTKADVEQRINLFDDMLKSVLQG